MNSSLPVFLINKQVVKAVGDITIDSGSTLAMSFKPLPYSDNQWKKWLTLPPWGKIVEELKTRKRKECS